jgi:hypothetical protein
VCSLEHHPTCLLQQLLTESSNTVQSLSSIFDLPFVRECFRGSGFVRRTVRGDRRTVTVRMSLNPGLVVKLEAVFVAIGAFAHDDVHL